MTGADGPMPIRRLMRERPALVYSVGIAVNALLILKGSLRGLIRTCHSPSPIDSNQLLSAFPNTLHQAAPNDPRVLFWNWKTP